MKWKRVHGAISYKIDKQTNQFHCTWTHEFDSIRNESEEVYFAYTYPYGYGESLVKTQKLMNKFE